MTEVIDTIADLRQRLGTGFLDDGAAPRPLHRPRLVVMTMGALHEGHLELVRAGRHWLENRGLGAADADIVVTIFVNPLQFDDPDDLARYPRTLDDDIAMCREAGVDIVFCPAVDDMYPEGEPSVTVNPGSLGEVLEGASRPGHFSGMLTVVNRLLMLIRPEAALFGEKDYQQLALIRRMTTDLLVPVHVVGVPTVREPDGVAMSSRNRRLSDRARAAAVALPHALERVSASLASGVDPVEAEADAAQWLADQPGVEQVDYLVVTSPDLTPPTPGEGRALVAAVVGGVRLIDNVRVSIPGGDR